MHLVRIDGKLPYDTHWEGHLLGEDATHKYLWIWHGFNFRALAVPHGDRGLVAYDYGWCYPRDADLVEQSFAAWNPDTQDEPPTGTPNLTGTGRCATTESTSTMAANTSTALTTPAGTEPQEGHGKEPCEH